MSGLIAHLMCAGRNAKKNGPILLGEVLFDLMSNQT